jgi:ABC-type molybdate transport system substrate-binding protein
LPLALAAAAQTQNCVAPSGQQLIIYRAGSLTRAFQPLEKTFTCQTGIQVRDQAMGSVDAGRQITAGGQACDLYAPADYLDIDLFMKPAGYADFDIVFAHGRMVLAYSPSGLTAKKLPAITAPGSAPFHAPDSIPKAAANWYEILTLPQVAIGGGNWFLDPGAYRAPMIFQLAEEFYEKPNLYNNLLEHLVIIGSNSGAVLGKQFDFQFTYEHNARATAASNPDYQYVDFGRRAQFFRPLQRRLLPPARGRGFARPGDSAKCPYNCRSRRATHVGHHDVKGRSPQAKCDQVSRTIVKPGRDGGIERIWSRPDFARLRQPFGRRKAPGIAPGMGQDNPLSF